MAFPLRGTPQIGSAIDGADVTLTFDVALQEGDVVFLYGGRGNSADAHAFGPITAGYEAVPVASGTNPIDTDTAPKFGLWKKVMGASPDSTVQGEGGGLLSSGVAYGCYVLDGSLVDAVIFDAPAVSTGEQAAFVPDGPAITTVTPGAWVVVHGLGNTNDTTRGTVAGYTIMPGIVGNDADDINIEAAYREIATPGVEDPPAWSLWSASIGGAITIAIRPAGADTTAPVLSAQTVDSITSNGGTPKVTTDEGNGTAYMVVVPNGDVPSTAQIKAGQQSSGAAALAASNQPVTASGVQTFAAVTGQAAETAYDVWFVHTDAALNNSTAVKADFTTLTAIVERTWVCQMMALTVVEREWTSFMVNEGPPPPEPGGLLDIAARRRRRPHWKDQREP